MVSQESKLKIKFSGKIGEGSQSNPILAAAQLQTYLNLNPQANNNKAKLNICRIKSGQNYKSKPTDSTIEGNIQSFDTQGLNELKKNIHEISKKVSETNGCEVDIQIDDFNPAVVNHKHQV